MIWTRRGFWPSVAILGAQTLIVASATAQQGTGVLTGRVEDAATRAPIADVVVTVTSPAVQGEQIVVTDSSGTFRVPNLPPGDYAIRYEKESYKPYQRSDVKLRADVTLRVDAPLLPEALKAEEVVVVAQAPTVDVGSSAQGMNISNDFTSKMPVITPGARGGAVRSFEAVAEVVPGARNDTYGVSINGGTSPENNYVIDGISNNNPAFGINGAPLSVEFVKEVNIIAGGYMPEYGRSTGGILNAVTKSGSNEFHGGVWMNVSPGGLEGTRNQIQRDGTSIETNPKQGYIGDLGADLGGPIVKDKLWFYAGLQTAQTQYHLNRTINQIQLDAAGNPVTNPDTGFTQVTPLQTTQYNAVRYDAQAFGKLTYSPNAQNRLNLTVFYLPSTAGGNGNYAIDPQTGQPTPSGNLSGAYTALGRTMVSNAFNAALKWTTETADKKILVDSTIGYVLQTEGERAADGSTAGSGEGLSAVPGANFRQSSPAPNSLTRFETVPGCDAPGQPGVLCPVLSYTAGGPGFLQERTSQRIQGRSVVTFLAEALGHHVAKAGIDLEYLVFTSQKAYSGGNFYRDNASGTTFQDYRDYAYLSAPDQGRFLNYLNWTSRSFTVGGFVQDSWSIMDKVTLNAGLRWDGQFLYGGTGENSMNLPNQWSPRVGLVWDPSQKGISKIYANYARFYTTVPLNLMDRAGSAEPSIRGVRPQSVCDPLIQSQAVQGGSCQDPANLIPAFGPAVDRRYARLGTGLAAIASDLDPQSSSEFVAGGELDVIRNGRIGAFYTKRWMDKVMEDMSRDEANTYFIGNPGYGSASDFPKAIRDYDMLTVFFQKAFSDGWIAQANYTLSRLYGNYEGLFRSDTGQLDPFITSVFDLKSLLINRMGPLSSDRTHEFKVFGSKDFDIPGNMLLQIGGSFRATSGNPTNYLGSHPIYGADEIYILESGGGNRMPWTYRFDLRVGYGIKVGKTQQISLSVDIFNLFNFQAATAVDERYTTADVLPIVNGTQGSLSNPANPRPITQVDGTPLQPEQVNPNYGNPTQFQIPRQFRFGLRTTF